MASKGQLGLRLGEGQNQTDDGERLYLLLSLRPPYYYQMKAGSKRYEYRRRFVSRPCTTFLYLGTTPRDPLSSTVPAWVEFGQPVVDHPSRIGELAEGQREGSSGSILQYFAGLERGYAIPVIGVTDIEPVSLGELRDCHPRFTAPQSYLVLNNYPDLLRMLLSRSAIARP
jgi:predicted transcriptional regulator